MNIGSPACGVNSIIRSFVRHGVDRNCTILAVSDGFEGLIANRVKELKWQCVYGWTGIGGSLIGCQRVEAKQIGFQVIAEKFREYKIDGLLLIGGFEAFTSVIQLNDQSDVYKEFCIPMICVPATISNNIPGSDFSIGCDTALNEIVTVFKKKNFVLYNLTQNHQRSKLFFMNNS
jgi:6-phosphofructokinase 1